MMQASDFGNLDNPARLRPLDRPPVGCILLEGEVSSRTVIVRQVPGRDPVQVALVQNEDVIEALVPHGADEAFRKRILPARCRPGRCPRAAVPSRRPWDAR